MSNQPNALTEQSQAMYSQYQTAVQQLQIIESQLNQIGSVIDELSMNLATSKTQRYRKRFNFFLIFGKVSFCSINFQF